VELSVFDEQRISVYLSGIDQFEPATFDDGNDYGTVICSASESRGHIFRRYAAHYTTAEFRGARYKNYIREAQTLVRAVDAHATFAVFPGDSRVGFPIPTFVKSRMIRDRGAPCVLLPLDRERHWGDIAKVARHDGDFKSKNDNLVWRGATTGVFTTGDARSPLSSRFSIATLNTAKAGLDIGYSEIVQIDDTAPDTMMAAIRARLLPPLSVKDQLRSKFLLSLEGNDVATGLKWMLYSNSAVLMPHPTCETWACEGELVPYVHYVPVKHDLSDLEEMYDWCLTHEAECEDIARNGKRFIGAFLDEAREAEICRQVISAYLGKATFTLRYGLPERLMQALTPLFDTGRSWRRSLR
jgi:hypothetical protein